MKFLTRYALYLATAAAFFAPAVVLAANLSVFPASVTLKKGDSVGFIVRLQSTGPVNTIGATVQLPPHVAFLSVSDGTVVTDWIQHPTFDKPASEVTFAGIMTNGWSGDGTLAVIKVAALEDGVYSLNFDQSQTELYKNDGKATPEGVVYGAAGINLFASPEAHWGAVILIVLVLVLWVALRRYRIRLV
jgi:hypothetical protein